MAEGTDETPTPPRGTLRVAGKRLVFFVDDADADGRRARRDRILQLQPTDPAFGKVVARGRRFRTYGSHWECLRANDLPMFVRAKDVKDLEDATWDAERVFAEAALLRRVFLRDRESGQLSWMLASETEPVLVATRLWSSVHRMAVIADIGQVQTALSTRPPWGLYSAT